MGFVKTTFFCLGAFTAYGTYSAIKLGKDLPKATRKMGQKVGMGYNYVGIL